MTETSAAARVFGTPELLETILLQLAETSKGWSDLLLSQRISQTFKATIGSSPKLQQTLHFRAVAVSSSKETADIHNRHVLQDIFDYPFKIDSSGVSLEISCEFGNMTFFYVDHPGIVNPELAHLGWDGMHDVQQAVSGVRKVVHTAATAAETVSGTTELLEAILLGLDTHQRCGLQTLLLSQRVCRTFQATIAGSSRIQEALFFRPIVTPKNLQHTDKRCGALNPVFLNLSGRQFEQRDFAKREIWVWCFMHVSKDLAAESHPGERRASVYLCARFNFSSAEPARELPCDSWQHMLFAQGDVLDRFRANAYDARGECISPGGKGEAGETIGNAMRRLWPRFCR
ncbi:hypothetical protein LTR27_002768 [Elasticomyces elasticus]|nr:hypothetical protein LTR27_002768 [Elasticomyces elasticus]